MYQGGGDQQGLGRASTTWVGRRFVGPRPNWSLCPAGSASTVTDFDVIGPLDSEPRSYR
jgi:hypothetical protein